jgi:hypothetical protein
MKWSPISEMHRHMAIAEADHPKADRMNHLLSAHFLSKMGPWQPNERLLLFIFPSNGEEQISRHLAQLNKGLRPRGGPLS